MGKKKKTRTNVKGRRGQSPLARVREIASALSDATEKKAWGAPTFRVANRMFAMFMDDHHGDGRVALWLNAEPGVQELLVKADETRFFVPPYQGPSGWTGIRVDLKPDWQEVAELMEEAHRYIRHTREEQEAVKPPTCHKENRGQSLIFRKALPGPHPGP